MAKTAQEYLAQNMAFDPGPGQHEMSKGKKIYGQPNRIPDFTPPARLLPPTDRINIKAESRENIEHLYGTALSHRQQQLRTVIYARQNMGFDNTPVIVRANWSYKPASDMLVNTDSWQELDPEKELAGF